MGAARDQATERIDRSDVAIRAGAFTLEAELVMPASASAVVLHVGPKPDARWLAEHLAREARFASLLVDPRAGEEEPIDLALFAQRIAVATDWVAMQDALRWAPLAYSGSGVGAAASLVTASSRRDVRAVVSRSGRPDLAGPALENVRMPTLLIVDEADDALVALNRSARPRLRAKSELAIIPRPAIAARAADWLMRALA